MHAIERMKSHGITDSLVMDVIKKPGKTNDETACMTIFQKVILDDGKTLCIVYL